MEENNVNDINYFAEVNDSSRFNNALLNEIRKTNQLLEKLILSIKPEPTLISSDIEIEEEIIPKVDKRKNRKKVIENVINTTS